MAEMAGILVFCLAVVAMAEGLLNWPERPKNPEEDREQMEYLEAWKKKHERTDKEK